MSYNLTLNVEATQLIVRCECGTIVSGNNPDALVERMRIHFGEFHPELGANVPADLILAMAEEKENKQQ
jgi:hypothetical protein